MQKTIYSLNIIYRQFITYCTLNYTPIFVGVHIVCHKSLMGMLYHSGIGRHGVGDRNIVKI